jgi:hypothetical protein
VQLQAQCLVVHGLTLGAAQIEAAFNAMGEIAGRRSAAMRLADCVAAITTVHKTDAMALAPDNPGKSPLQAVVGLDVVRKALGTEGQARAP